MLASRKLVSFGVRQMSTWQIFGSAMLERKALIARKFNPLEKAYIDLLHQVEVENSLLSDFELRIRNEKESREKSKIGAAQVKIKFAEDDLAEWKKEAALLQKILKPTTVTDKKSVKRCLDQAVTFLVKTKLGNEAMWLFPQSENQADETLRETAERALVETVGNKLQFITLGNAPCAFYQYKYPKQVQDSTGFGGAKIFYFRIQYVNGDVELNSNIDTDHMWANCDELLDSLPKPIAKAVKPSIFVMPSIDFTPFLDAITDQKELERLEIAQKSC